MNLRNALCDIGQRLHIGEETVIRLDSSKPNPPLYCLQCFGSFQSLLHQYTVLVYTRQCTVNRAWLSAYTICIAFTFEQVITNKMQSVLMIGTPETKVFFSKSVRYADVGFTPLQRTTVSGRMRLCGVWMTTLRVSLFNRANRTCVYRIFSWI